MVACQVPGIVRSARGLVGLVSVHCDWVRSAPWRGKACCWNVKHPTDSSPCPLTSIFIESDNYLFLFVGFCFCVESVSFFSNRRQNSCLFLLSVHDLWVEKLESTAWPNCSLSSDVDHVLSVLWSPFGLRSNKTQPKKSSCTFELL